MHLHRLLATLAALVLVGCGDAPAHHEKPDAGPTGCAPGELTREDGSCQPAGLPPDLACAPGELEVEDGSCQPAGVPPSACAPGFLPEDGGCTPILPANPCPAGQMAIPGEMACREVSPCGSGTWGDIPVEANTQFVDGAYQGGTSDGTEARPWTTIQEGVNAAAPGAIVAVAAGTYAEDVRIQGKAVRLWGRCSAMVEVAGGGLADASIRILGAGASGAEVRDLAVTGAEKGLRVAGAQGVAIDRVWVHDAGSWGVAIVPSGAPAEVTLTGSLLDHNRELGVALYDSIATIEATVVRDTQPNAAGRFGRGVDVEDDPDTDTRASLTLHASVVEQNHDAGVYIGSADATIEATAVQDTQPDAMGLGRGVSAEPISATGPRASVIVRASVLARNHEAAMFVLGSDATVEATVMRETQPDTTTGHGRGIEIQQDPDTAVRSIAAIRACLVDRSQVDGVLVFGSDATIEATVVRGTLPNALSGEAHEAGQGVAADGRVETMDRSHLTLRGCVVEQTQGQGVFVRGSDATIESTVVRDTQLDTTGAFGQGVSVQNDSAGARANATLRGCVVEQNHLLGVSVFGSDALIEATVVRGNLPGAAGHGAGVGIADDEVTRARASVTLRACLVEQNFETGVVVLSSDAQLDASIVRGTSTGADDNFGDGLAVVGGSIAIRGSLVTDNARAGVASFGGTVEVSDTHLFCNAFDLEGEPLDGAGFSFDGSDGWQCTVKGADDCNDLGACHVETAGLAPPPSLPPAAPLP